MARRRKQWPAGRRSPPARGGRAPGRPRRPAAAPLDLSPARYIKKVDRLTGTEIPGPIDPEELLVHAHRDNHPVEIAAQFAASRFIQLTGNEALVKRGLKIVNRLGGMLGEGVGRAHGEPRAGAASEEAPGRDDRGTWSSSSARRRTCRRSEVKQRVRARPEGGARPPPGPGSRAPPARCSSPGPPASSERRSSPRPRRTAGSRKWWRWCGRRRCATRGRRKC